MNNKSIHLLKLNQLLLLLLQTILLVMQLIDNVKSMNKKSLKTHALRLSTKLKFS